jgi:hypothetical protein
MMYITDDRGLMLLILGLFNFGLIVLFGLVWLSRRGSKEG